MSLTTWLICWYLVGFLTIIMAWLDDAQDVKLIHLIVVLIFSVAGPLMFLAAIPWPDITLVRRR